MTKNDIMSITGQNLRRYRLERRLTQEAIAFKANISVSFYAALESGRKSMSMLVLLQLADALEVSTDYLIRTPNTEYQVKNINKLLSNQPEKFINSIEKMIKLCIEEFSSEQV